MIRVLTKLKKKYVSNSVLTSKLGGYAPYTDHTFEILSLENELDKYASLNRIFFAKMLFWR